MQDSKKGVLDILKLRKYANAFWESLNIKNYNLLLQILNITTQYIWRFSQVFSNNHAL